MPPVAASQELSTPLSSQLQQLQQAMAMHGQSSAVCQTQPPELTEAEHSGASPLAWQQAMQSGTACQAHSEPTEADCSGTSPLAWQQAIQSGAACQAQPDLAEADRSGASPLACEPTCNVHGASHDTRTGPAWQGPVQGPLQGSLQGSLQVSFQGAAAPALSDGLLQLQSARGPVASAGSVPLRGVGSGISVVAETHGAGPSEGFR